MSSGKATPPPRGVFVPVPTFFTPTGELDLETQVRHTIFLAKNGIKGAVFLGSTGEGVHVHPKERKVILSTVRQALDAEGLKDFIVVAGTATQNVQETVDQLVEAKEAGAKFGQCLAPAYNAAVTGEKGLTQWITSLADKSPLPLIIYNYPGVSNGLVVPASVFVTLSQHPNIVGCKLSHGDVSLIQQIVLNPATDNEHFHLYTGLGQILLAIVPLGAAGAVDGTAGWFPKTLCRLYELSAKAQPTSQEAEERKKISFRVARMTELVVKHGVPGIKEATSRIRGFGTLAGTRLPLYGGIQGGDAEWANWVDIMNDCEEIEKSL